MAGWMGVFGCRPSQLSRDLTASLFFCFPQPAQTNGSMTAGASVDGIIVRDLQVCYQTNSILSCSRSARFAYPPPRPLPLTAAPQLSQSARHAYVLRPLPARARRLNTWHAALRRTLLGIAPVSHGKKL